ncbi:MAG: hypothetical protein QOE70_1257 [Chthoniobacter sp.]|jgi:hypothetical protein|nr:hypothetical protein [Chthoniobacter sp.]
MKIAVLLWLSLGVTVPRPSLAGESAGIAKLLGLPAIATAASKTKPSPIGTNAAGLPEIGNRSDAFSAGIVSTFIQPGTSGGAAMLGDWDGREDQSADHSSRITQLSGNTFFSRFAISEHTVANGFNENVFYGGDNVGNFWIFTDTTGSLAPESMTQINLPELVGTQTSGGVTLVNPTSGDFTSAGVVITGLAVSPVADLGDFGAANSDVIGEIVYVSLLDVDGGAANAANQPLHTRIFAFGFTDGAGGLTCVGARQLLRSPLFNIAGLCVDEDGSLYFHLADLIQKNGGAIFKATEVSRPVTGAAVNPRINRAIPLLASPPSINSWQGTSANPVITASGVRLTNFSGPSTLFGNLVALCAGPDNRIYAAAAASSDSNLPGAGPFAGPATFGATPSMIISFADRRGGDEASSPTPAGLPNGLSDSLVAGQARIPGANNFKVYALGNGPDRRVEPSKAVDGSLDLAVFGTTASTLKLDMQIDYSIYSGIVVDEDFRLHVVSGGTPAGVGLNPSPSRGEILSFSDRRPQDRRADFVDFRGDTLPNPPASGGNVGDGDSDRFDHLFLVAPIDGNSFLPQGISGLARGFLRYPYRLAPNAMSTGVTLGQTGGQPALGASDSVGPLVFESFDPGHQVAGGDDQNTPFRGDDNDGAGAGGPNPGPLNGGFEFSFGGPVGTANAIQNNFFLNSAGNVTFGAASTDNTPTVAELRTGPRRIAPAWMDLNFQSRVQGNLNTFPLTALGFAGVNAFKVRYINVPETGKEAAGSSNTFSLTLYDDGTSIDENANQALNPPNPIGNNSVPFDLQEGPTDLRFVREPVSNVIIGEIPRRDGTGRFSFDYVGLSALGLPANPVLVGFSLGNLPAGDPPGLCDINLSEAARTADDPGFQVIQSETASITKGLIGDGTEPALQEFFNTGDEASGVSDLDLKSEGSDAAVATLATQMDLNREHVAFYGTSSAPPPNATISTVIGIPDAVTAGTTAIINAYCDLPILIVGQGFFPDEMTTICEGEATERTGRTVSTKAVMTIDIDGNGVPDFTQPLTDVTPISENLITATIPKTLPGSPFPLSVVKGQAFITVTTTFSSGDNNVFSPFTRTAVGLLQLGNRAPVVTSITPTTLKPAAGQHLQLTGAAFRIPNTPTPIPNVTRVYAVRISRGKISRPTIDATSFTIDSDTQVSAVFDFRRNQNRYQFLIFAEGPNGTSRNALTLPPGADSDCPLGNEEGNVIKLTLKRE